jgi:uncharacterized protein YjbI with pentapeptide repeats
MSSALMPAASHVWDQGAIERVVALHERFLQGVSGGRRAVLKHASAPGIDCRRRVLNDADFTGANLAGSAFAGAHFERAALYCVNLEGCDLRAANLRRADLRGARLCGAVLSGAVIDEADMRAAYIGYAATDEGLGLLGRGATAQHNAWTGGSAADFTNCAMRGVRFCAANLKGANFTGADLGSADFNGARLTDAIFRDTILEGVDVEALGLSPEQLSGCLLAPTPAALARAEQIRERLQQAEDWVASDGRRGAPANIDGEDLRPLQGVFRERRLTALSAKHVRAVRLDFAGSTLQGAVFDGADLRGAVFDGCDLRGASFRGARLSHARFQSADLAPLALPDGRAYAASFAGAAMDRTDFSNTVMAACR